MKRKEFIKAVAPAVLLLANGKLINANDALFTYGNKKKILRFAVASDGHYGLKNTDYEGFYNTLVTKINEEHKKEAFEFCMINGDIIHDDPQFFEPSKTALDKLLPKYYVTQGNHDHASPELWQGIWNLPVNFDFKIGNITIIGATTSDEKGTYLCPDVKWLHQKLTEHRKQQHIFIFIHINPGKLTKYAVDCPELFEVFGKYKNIRAVFNGHDHDEDGIKIKNGIPFIFDAHFGGDWGTAYRGFRIVELLKDGSVLTYIMNPDVMINKEVLK